MSQDKYGKPQFTLSLLHPKNWGVWLGFGTLALIVNLLPYAVLLKLGQSLGLLGMRLGKKRVHVAKRNFELAFPDKGRAAEHYFSVEYPSTFCLLHFLPFYKSYYIRQSGIEY